MTASSVIPRTIGVTGGIGCGKSTVVAAFGRLGIPAFVADRAGAACYDDPLFCRQVADLFGQQVMHDALTVDKQRLAALVFSNAESLARLNALVHPRVMEAFDRWLHLQQTPYVLFESAILYDCGLDRLMDATVVVHLDREERIRRLLLRDRCSRHDIELRMSRQMDGDVLLDRADYVILNYEGNPRQRQVAYIHEQILNRI